MKNRFLKNVVLATAAAVVLMLSGCFPTGEKDPNAANVIPESEFFEYEAENLTVRFKIPDEPPDNVPTRIRLKEKYFDTDEMLEMFFDGRTIDEAAGNDMFTWTTDKSILKARNDLNEIRFSDGDYYRAGMEIPENFPINYQLNLWLSKEQYRDIYGIGEEIEDFPSRNAIDRALELCSTLGITNLGKPKIYAFDLGVYERIEGFADFWLDPDVPLTKDNEVYMLRFPQTFSGIRLVDMDTYSYYIDDATEKTGKGMVCNPEVVVGVSKTGIFYIEVKELYEAEYEIISTEPIKYDFNYALNELSNYFEGAYFKDETKFTSADIVYLPVERKEEGYTEYALAWCFSGFVPVRDLPQYDNYNIVFNAENGARRDYKY